MVIDGLLNEGLSWIAHCVLLSVSWLQGDFEDVGYYTGKGVFGRVVHFDGVNDVCFYLEKDHG